MKIYPLVLCPQLPLDGITSGIFPYLGGSVRADQLRSVVMAYESVIVPGRKGAELAAKIPGVLIDPAAYAELLQTLHNTLSIPPLGVSLPDIRALVLFLQGCGGGCHA